MDEDVTLKTGFKNGEEKLMIKCAHELLNHAVKKLREFKKEFPNIEAGIFMGNVLVNFVGNAIRTLNDNITDFSEGSEQFIEHFNHYVNSLILYELPAKGEKQ